MSQQLVRADAGVVAARIRAVLGGAGFTIVSDQADSVQIGGAGQLGERHNIVFERRSGTPTSELVQVWVVESGVGECAVTVFPEGDLARSLLARLVAGDGDGDGDEGTERAG